MSSQLLKTGLFQMNSAVQDRRTTKHTTVSPFYEENALLYECVPLFQSVIWLSKKPVLDKNENSLIFSEVFFGTPNKVYKEF